MHVETRSLLSLDMAYALHSRTDQGVTEVIAATEGHGPIYRFTTEQWEPSLMLPGPGGTMSLADVPGNRDELLLIMGCFPGYDFHNAGVYRAVRKAGGGGESTWTAHRISDLPFGHRIAAFKGEEGVTLIATTLAKTKQSPDDWSEPGAIYRATLPEVPTAACTFEPVVEGLHKNHGMGPMLYNGVPALYYSAAEGLFALPLSQLGQSTWHPKVILDREVSEAWLGDINGDGQPELVTIEPFHGSRLRVYRQESDASSAHLETPHWKPVWETEIAFGHGLWCGTLTGKQRIIVASRAGTRNLELHTVVPGKPFRVASEVVAHGSGTAGVLVFPTADGAEIVATNQSPGQVCRYTVVL